MFENLVKEDLDKFLENLEDSKFKEVLEYNLRGGKCMRAFIVKHIMEKLSGESDWRPVSAVEVLHCSSLMLDDLPCMDNDSLRRNKLSSFKKFDEKSTILVSLFSSSSTLQLLFDSLKDYEKNGKLQQEDVFKFVNIISKEWTDIVKNLSKGQMLDLSIDVEKNIGDSIENSIENIIIYKTGSLFSFSFLLGAIFSFKDVDLEDFRLLGKLYGNMFQIADDFKDMETDKVENNFVLLNGKENSLQFYNKSKEKFVSLLEKNNLYTSEMMSIVDLLDNSISKLD